MKKKASKNKLYLRTSDVAELIGESTDAARYMLKKHNALVKRDGHYFTTREMLLAAFPEMYRVLPD